MDVDEQLEYCTTTLDLKKTIETSFIALGERLSKIRFESLWRSNWNSFAEYLMEMKINESTASRLISVYDTYVGNYKIDESKLAAIGWSNLYDMIPLVKTREKAEELVDKTSEMRKEDVREEIRAAKFNCTDHDWVELHIQTCRICGKKHRIM